MTEKRYYMCATDFDHELGKAIDGVKVYPSVKDLRKDRKCIDDCGVAEISISLIRKAGPASAFPEVFE